MCVCMYMCVCVYMYIYIYREREIYTYICYKDDIYVYMIYIYYIYTHISCIEREREIACRQQPGAERAAPVGLLPLRRRQRLLPLERGRLERHNDNNNNNNSNNNNNNSNDNNSNNNNNSKNSNNIYKASARAPWLRTNGVDTNGVAAKVMNFDSLGKKVHKINVC